MKGHLWVLALVLLSVPGPALCQAQSLSDYAKSHPLGAKKKGTLIVADAGASVPKPTPESGTAGEDSNDLCRVQTFAEIERLGNTLKPPPGAKVTEPVLLHRSKPEYPASLRRRYIQGKVIVKAIVSCDGTLKDVTVMKSSHRDLERLAIDALPEWRYKPGLVDGRPRPFILSVVVDFTLGKSPA